MFVVTGGGSGIGRALARSLADREQEVLIVGRRETWLAETASYSSHIRYMCADLASPEGRQQLVHELRDESRLDGLVHNAGVIDPIAPMGELTDDAWRLIMAINLDAPFFLTKALKDKLHHHARVLNIGSGAAYFPVVGWAPYCVSKAGLSMLTRCWQLEYPHLACASVMPGIIDTDMQASIRAAHHMEKEKQAFFQDLKDRHQLLSVDNVASFLTWLLLDVDKNEFVSKEWDIYDPCHAEFIHAS